MNRTKLALFFMSKNPGVTANEAAKKAKVSPSAVYRAIKANKKERCPHCGAIMRDKT